VLPTAALLLAACGGKPADEPAMSRTEGVKAAPAQVEAADRWCDVFYDAAHAPSLFLPKLVSAREGEPLPTLSPDRWTWINLWASWCVPCRREMPLLERWHEQLGRDGIPIDLWFISVDDRQEDLARFLAANPTMAPGPSARIASFALLQPWLAHFKGAPADTIPIQIIAAPGGKVRCVRAGSLADGDYPAVKLLMTR
jgi:thiol-disulfide isomerase/thioredoxin